MAEESRSAFGAGPSHRAVEIGFAVATIVFALIVIGGSAQVGFNWASDGPRAGFFPFYIGLFILVSGAVNLFQAFSAFPRERLYAEWGQLGQVLSVVVPAAIYVAIIPWLGIYVSSTLLIAVFMRRIGKYGWSLVAPIAVVVPIVAFIVFEKWFQVPLPKGPIEELLGF